MNFNSSPAEILDLSSFGIQNKIYVKRDDLIHPIVSGNKWRKLKENFDFFSSSKFKGIISLGGAYSSHILSLSFICFKKGIPCVLIIRGEEPKVKNDILIQCLKYGAKLHFCSRSQYSNQHWINEFVLENHPSFFLIPEGGANKYGISGCRQIIKELKIAISNKSFILFFLGSLTLSISWGLLNSLTLFINTDFWGLKGSQIGIFLYIYFGAAFLAFYITPKFVAIIGKRNFVLLCVLGVALSAPIAFISYNLGLTPEKGTTTLVLFLCVPLIFISTLSIAGNMARDAMIGDIADEVDLQSGKRQEGVLYSAVSFVQKVNTAIGSLTGGLTLWVLNITSETPTYDQAYSLFFVQGVIGPILLIIPILFFYFYSLDKKRHSEILRQLKERS